MRHREVKIYPRSHRPSPPPPHLSTPTHFLSSSCDQPTPRHPSGSNFQVLSEAFLPPGQSTPEHSRVSLKAPPTEIRDCAVLCVNSKGFALQLPFVKGAFLVAQMVKNPSAIQDAWVLSLGSGRSPAEGTGHPLQYPCLENSMDRGAWQARVEHNGVTNTHFLPLVNLTAPCTSAAFWEEWYASVLPQVPACPSCCESLWPSNYDPSCPVCWAHTATQWQCLS